MARRRRTRTRKEKRPDGTYRVVIRSKRVAAMRWIPDARSRLRLRRARRRKILGPDFFRECLRRALEVRQANVLNEKRRQWGALVRYWRKQSYGDDAPTHGGLRDALGLPAAPRPRDTAGALQAVGDGAGAGLSAALRMGEAAEQEG